MILVRAAAGKSIRSVVASSDTVCTVTASVGKNVYRLEIVVHRLGERETVFVYA